MAVNVSEELVQRLAPDEESVQAARSLVQNDAFLNLGVSADGTWLLGECRGSAQEPYQVSADFADPAAPTLRCSCPARKQPCKHGLGLLLAYQQDPGRFGTREPSEDLLIKREKKAALDEKKRTGAAVPRKVSRAAQDKRTAAQREGLEMLEKLLVELVAGGQWFEESKLERMDRLAKHLSDAFLPGPMQLLRRLVLVGRAKDLSDDERALHSTEALGQLWAATRLGRQYLEGRVGEADPVEAETVQEEVLGRVPQFAELQEKGYVRSGLSLLELAFERTDDEARQQRLETSSLLDLDAGELYQSINYRPFKGLSQVPDQPTYAGVLTVKEAAVSPGYVNRRIRWEKGAEQVGEAADGRPLEKAYEFARAGFREVVDAFRQQLERPLAPREVVALVRMNRIGRVGKRVIMEDTEGTRVEAADKRGDYSNVSNLVRAAGMLGKDRPAVLVRLFLRPAANTIVAQPLAALTPKHHLRLGL